MRRIFSKTTVKILFLASLFFIILFLIIVYILSTNYQKLETVEIEAPFSTDTIPFTFSNSGHLLVDVRFPGDSNSYPFIIDSGASNIIFKNKSSDFNLENNGYGIGKGANGNYFLTQIKKVNSIEIQSLTFNNFNVEEVNHNFKCFNNVYGLIGTGLMHRLNWQIDFQNKIIVVSKNFRDLKLGDDQIKLELEENQFSHHLSLPLKFSKNGAYFNSIIDLGNRGYLSLNEKEIIKNSLDLNYKKVIGTKSSGLGDTEHRVSNEKIHFIGTMFLGNNYEIKDFVVSANPDAINLLGLGFFKNYKTTINWQAKQLILEPYADNPNFVDDTFGFELDYDENENKIFISSIIQNSVADNNKLVLKSKIISVNDVHFFDYNSLCEYNKMIEVNDTINLRIKLEDEIKEYKLIKEPIFTK